LAGLVGSGILIVDSGMAAEFGGASHPSRAD
jgi:hypothetical protein